MSNAEIALSNLQSELMKEFYGYEKAKVLFDKKIRDCLWKIEKNGGLNSNALKNIEEQCPALAHQVRKHRENKKNIQSSVFSECVYAQTFANIFNLGIFANCIEDKSFLSDEIVNFLKSYSLVPRYAYANKNKSRMLIQAGSCGGIDSALITIVDYKIFTIEFKEPYAKSSELDLPKYGEDGKLVITDEFISKYPQFEKMLKEQENLNFFDVIGNNVHEFSKESIRLAITNNYVKKYADVVCTEDQNGYLTMLPINQIPCWAKIEGEIRPAGRNKYKVFTPNALISFLKEKKAIIKGDKIKIEKKNLAVAKERGSYKNSRYKINSLFFVYTENCIEEEGFVCFSLHDVYQLNPTIAAKMKFEKLNFEAVKKYYGF